MEDNSTIDEILIKKGISLVNDTDELKSIIEKIISENEKSVLDYKNGKDNAIKYLMGLVMKETKGSANPRVVNELLIDLLLKM